MAATREFGPFLPSETDARGCAVSRSSCRKPSPKGLVAG